MKVSKPNFQLFLFFSVFLAACGPDYKYDTASGLCKNKKGAVGYNNSGLSECSKVTSKDSKLSSKTVKSGTSLRGLHAEGANLRNVGLSGTDLTGAVFAGSTDLFYANLRNANLQDTRFLIPNMKMTSVSSVSNTKISEHTQFPLAFLSNASTANSVTDFGISVISNPTFSFKSSQLPSSFSAQMSDKIQEAHLALAAADLTRLNSDLYSSGNNLEYFPGPGSNAAFEFVNTRVAYWGSQFLDVGVVAFNITSYLYFNSLFIDLQRRSDEIFKASGSTSSPTFSLGKPDSRPVNLEAEINHDHSHGHNHSHVHAAVNAKPLGISPTLVFRGNGLLINSHQGGGVAAFSNVYMGLETPQLARLGTLVHESRHSECKVPQSLVDEHQALLKKIQKVKSEIAANGLSSRTYNSTLEQKLLDLKTQLKQFEIPFLDRNGQVTSSTYSSKQFQLADCGFSHIDCPSDHPSEGMRGAAGACDDSPHGAYNVGASFLSTVISNCKNCKPFEIEIARIKAADQFDRYVGETHKHLVRNRGSGPFTMKAPNIDF